MARAQDDTDDVEGGDLSSPSSCSSLVVLNLLEENTTTTTMTEDDGEGDLSALSSSCSSLESLPGYLVLRRGAGASSSSSGVS
eukprot:CAMPEP_0203759988 /NCGR_PEP_ID=MMETSP0098-20131031/13359_1 /ASSEMBLY_ACC=CAM_ASM_000208 /TAXON_ID=96639 /ORGANISM=" , Strain NY0313808BC1" /LENGTH=82 /DNA_ID=CAMNT_0050653367 /DNA_START=310 /DNA_END=558 /DNA_ORIENTATION=-